MSVKIRTKKDSDILYLDIHYGNGRRIRRSMGLKDNSKNRKLLEKEFIPDIEKKINEGTFDPNKREKKVFLLGEYALICFERHNNDRREHVSKRNLMNFNKHILPYFGKRRLDSIKTMELLDWQNEKLKSYEESSVKKFRAIFNQILRDALFEELIEKNPFAQVLKPKKQKKLETSSKINPFSLDEVNDLISKADGYLKNFIAISAFTGMRPGELLALRWDDIDFENETISINKTRILGSDGLPKTRASRREIEILPIVKKYFLQQYSLTKDNVANQVFCSSNNKPFYSHDNIASRFKKLLSKDDNRYLYQLRHTFASMMINEGEDISWVSQMMGHENVDITLRTYTHFYKLSENKKDRKKRALFLENVSVSSLSDIDVA